MPEHASDILSPGRVRLVLPTGLTGCFDLTGKPLPCCGSGQDGDDREAGQAVSPRFAADPQGPVRDAATGLMWHPSANYLGYPVSFDEAQAAVRTLNHDAALGRTDWRLPNRRELRSLLNHGAKKPALPAGHPFTDVFLGRCWTSTTFAGLLAHAWYVHLEGARVFYERKDRYCLVWPVCGQSQVLAATGQTACYDAAGRVVDCTGSGQDGETRCGVAWPTPRFAPGRGADAVLDRLTGLSWRARPLGATPDGGLPGPVHWGQALEAVAELAARDGQPWRLPDINELESLTDMSRASPSLPEGHPFTGLGDGFWSSTTSFYDPAWAYVLYLGKGAVGVGFKIRREFFVWPVLRPGP